MTRQRAAVGFTVKSGWAAAVLLEGPRGSPRPVDSRRIELSDPQDPDSRQPYHAGFGTARADDERLAELLRVVRREGRSAVTGLLREYAGQGHRCAGVGLVVGSVIDPSTIANAHIRIHALEGQLFRGVVEQAAGRAGVRCFVWRERDLFDAGVRGLKTPETRVRAQLAAMAKAVGGPWRREQKCAALAAWLVLGRVTTETRAKTSG